MSQTFADLGLPQELVSPLRKAGITEPFPIQAAAIPDALNGRDVLGRAPTGSGKTLAFGLPLLATVSKSKPHRPRSLILSPTRELAEQIRRELAPIAAGRGLRLLTVYGGVSYHPQRSKLRRGVDVLIACPGRLQDLIEQGDLTLEAAEYVVIDEADRMADMGFMPQVRKLLDMTPRRRQTVLFSATLDGDVAELTRRYQKDPVRHETGGDALDAGTARHHFWRVEHSDRLDVVADLVGGHGSTLVFTRTRRGADRLARQLHKHGVTAEAIHGGRSQRQRDRALRHFKNGQAEALIATDVAARGIHVDGVECVVHFDPPEDHKAYLHRSGRTARAGAGGHVVSLIQHDQVKTNHRLQSHLGLSGTLVKPSMEGLSDRGGELLGKPSTASGDKRPRNRSGAAGQQRRGSRNRSGRRAGGSNRGRSNEDNRRSTGSKSNGGSGRSRQAGPGSKGTSAPRRATDPGQRRKSNSGGGHEGTSSASRSRRGNRSAGGNGSSSRGRSSAVQAGRRRPGNGAGR